MTATLHADVPGVVLHHTPASSGLYVGCPAILVLPSGDLIASHSHFGPKSTKSESFVYTSSDKGQGWRQIATLKGQIWSKIFVHQDHLYIIGTDQCDRVGERVNGALVIRRSTDNGRTWTVPTSPATGLLTDEPGYHTAPVSVVRHQGRIWKAFEHAGTGDRDTWQTMIGSAPEDCDLLDRANWTFSQEIGSWPSWTWLEGNAVVTPDGNMAILSRTNDLVNRVEWPAGKKIRGGNEETAALTHVGEDGRTLSHDPVTDRIAFSGGGSKFTVRFDAATATYIALVNSQPDRNHWRNTLSLAASPDLRQWRTCTRLLHHPDPNFHAFQYVDWDFDGEDIVYLSRTAHDDGLGGAHNAHDANYCTFHRLERFRQHLSD